MEQHPYEFDVIVVGGGPGGYVAAIRAAQLGARVALVERGALGGTCVNRGCIPTKALYHAAHVWRTINGALKEGFTVENASFDWPAVLKRKNVAVKKLATGVSSLLSKSGVTVLSGEARVERAHEVLLDRAYTARHIVLATGSKPVCRVPSEDRLLTTDDILDLPALPASLAIIGGGVVGCEIASIFAAFGVKVTVIEFMPRILPMFDAEVAETLRASMSAAGIKIITNARVVRVTGSKPRRVALEDGAEIECETVLEAIGRAAETAAFSGLGLELNAKGYVRVDENYLTSVGGVYAVGDVNGLSQLAHSASHQGIAAVEHALLGKSAEPQLVPACVFALLEIASVGITLDEAKAAGYAAAVESKFAYAGNGKAASMGATKGFAKVVCDEDSGRILGAHIVGESASTIIHEAVMAMRAGLTAKTAGETIHAHPTLSETLMEAFLGAAGCAVHG